jgi:hypothetical protein
MGEHVEMMLEGILCQYCGGYVDDLFFDEAPGFPRSCETCDDDPEHLDHDSGGGKSIRNMCCVCYKYIGKRKDGTLRKLPKKNNNRCQQCIMAKKYPKKKVSDE